LTLSEYHLVVPAVVAEEVCRVLAKKFKLTPAALAAAEAVLDRCEIIPKGSQPSPISVRDPDDELVLAGALAGGAQILISGDADLLSVAAQSPIPILSPRAFMALTRGGAL
jgi:predicted nucleic acid-binding protein